MNTLGMECKMKTLMMGQKEIGVQLWDTAGQERFRAITPNYYRNSHGVMVVFDVTNRKSFDMVSVWLSEIANSASQNICTALIANKTDQGERVVSLEEGKQFACENYMDYFETSAKSGTGVQQAFDLFVCQIFDRLTKDSEVNNRRHGHSLLEKRKRISSKKKK